MKPKTRKRVSAVILWILGVLLLAIILIAGLSGCTVVKRGSEAAALLADKDQEIAKVKADAQRTISAYLADSQRSIADIQADAKKKIEGAISDTKAKTDFILKLICYGLVVIGVIGGALAGFIGVKSGSLSMAGAGVGFGMIVVAFALGILFFSWQIALFFVLAGAAVVLCAIVALFIVLYRKYVSSDTALQAIVPAIEAMGVGPQADKLKATIQENAGEALETVKGVVTAIKTASGKG